MLPCQNGASTLGKTLRRPIVNTMSSLESLAHATESMRSTVSRTGARALSSVTRSTAHPPLKTWHPSHGIVFRPISSTSRASNTAATAELRADHLLHSNAEDNYVLASADISDVGREARSKLDDVEDDTPVKVARQTAEELHQLALDDPEQDELPQTSSSYKIPESIFRAAKEATPGSHGSYWSHSLYRSPPDAEGKTLKPVVHYCRTIHTTEKVIKDYFTGKTVIGFDIEWQPEALKLSKARKNVSLIQIACEDRIALFHLALYPRNAKTSDSNLEALVAPSLKKMLENPNITKVGVAIKGDCTRLRKYLDINVQGLLELSHLHKLVRFSKSKDFGLINRALVSLGKQVQEHLHLPLFKGDEVRNTDWSQKLDMAQIMYAASDSYAGLQLYHTLELKRLALDPVPPRPYPAELNKPIRFAEGIEVPPEDDEPKVTPIDARVVLRTRKNNKKADAQAAAEAAEIVKDEDSALPTPELSHSFFTSSAAPSDVKTPTTTTKISRSCESPLQKANASTDSFIRSLKGKLGDVSHIPLAPSHLAKRSLKTYFLWLDNPSLKLEAIGAMLRSPPLSSRSVAKMILEAIVVNRVPYEKRRLRDVLRVYALTVGGRYIDQHPYYYLARDSGYLELIEKELDEAGEKEGDNKKIGWN